MPLKKLLNAFQLFGLFAEMGFIIAVPLALMMFFAVKIDRYLHTTPAAIFVALLLSVASSTYGIHFLLKKGNIL